LNIIAEWGYPLPSILSAEHSGQCIDFKFENTVVPSDVLMQFDYEGHALSILSGSGDLPEAFTVVPAVGWQLISDSPSTALDWATTVITVCQQLLG
jgi:hypothetical protein